MELYLIHRLFLSTFCAAAISQQGLVWVLLKPSPPLTIAARSLLGLLSSCISLCLLFGRADFARSASGIFATSISGRKDCTGDNRRSRNRRRTNCMGHG